jgi:adenylate cyclase
MGEQVVKNIARPIRVFRVALPSIGQPTASTKPALALPDKPSIAVLPFQNMSGDPEQEYFADGMVEDIITALSRVKWFFVIARNSSFTYKGKAVDVKQMGRELGVRYVLEGSVRKAAGRVRITCQLIEAASGHHIWADRFEGSLEDVFALQDQVTERVVGVIEPSVRQAEINRGRTKPTDSLDAYDCYLRALPNFYQVTREGFEIALQYLYRAIEIDPQYALAKAFAGLAYVRRNSQGFGEQQDKARAIELARETIEKDRDNPETLHCAGHVLGFFTEEHDRALTLLERAVALNPNSARIQSSLGWVQCYACRPLEAITHFERAMRLSPRDPEMMSFLSGLALAHLVAGRDENVLIAAHEAMQEMPNWAPSYRLQAAALARLGRLVEAGVAAKCLLKLDPGFTIATRLPKFRDPAFRESYSTALKVAGLPE